jgi:hypothetical protein
MSAEPFAADRISTRRYLYELEQKSKFSWASFRSHPMRNVNGSSRKIAELLIVIDGIAFQSDLLSLSASIAAAGAGGDSQGFSLAVDEVRRLAHRGAQAANTYPPDEQKRIL